MTPQQCFRVAGQRLAAGQPFCHPNNGDDRPWCGHVHNFEVTEPNGTFLVLADGSSIPLHTSWLLCTDHDG